MTKISQPVTRILCLFGLWAGLGWQAQAQTRTVHLYYTDPQGTVLAKTDAQGSIIAQYDYTPYGNTVASLGNPPDGPGYTGHVNDTETGLVYMQARYYHPMGRFLSPDPVGPTPGNVYSFNRYAYANNNPIVNTDPTGEFPGNVDDCAGSAFPCFMMSSGSSGGGFIESQRQKTTTDPNVGIKASAEANKALSGLPRNKFSKKDDLVKAWAAAVMPVALKYNTEILSKIFNLGTEFTWAPAFSSGNICSPSYCFVSFQNAPNLGSGVLAGYVHTHPSNVGFSSGDLATAYNAYNSMKSIDAISAYVAMPNGTIMEWNTSMYFNSPWRDDWQKYSVYSRKVK